jgi:hypothetical protein
MIIKLLALQIPIFWETIKFVAKKVDEIDDKDLPSYLNELLHALLCDKAQCFVILDDKRILVAMAISRILGNKVNRKKYLYIQCLYSFKVINDDMWQDGLDLMRKFAEKEKCSYISFDSRNPRIWDIGGLLGCYEAKRTFTLNIGGV